MNDEKIVYDVVGFNEYVTEDDYSTRHNYFTNIDDALVFIDCEINEMVRDGLFDKEDLNRPKWNLFKLGDEYTFRIDKYAKVNE